VRSNGLPACLEGLCDASAYRRWLERKAQAHVRRDRKRYGHESCSGARYRDLIHADVERSAHAGHTKARATFLSIPGRRFARFCAALSMLVRVFVGIELRVAPRSLPPQRHWHSEFARRLANRVAGRGPRTR
jgi:hypothetical protein